MYYDNDADPSALAGQKVAIIGYGSQGHAHALNLHESGVDVVVGLAPGSKSRPLAEEAGLRVADVADAVREADVIMILVPDTGQKAVYDTDIAPNLRPGQLLMFAHGFNIHFGRIDPPGTVDVGWSRRRARATCCGACTRPVAAFPSLFAVHRDNSGTARPRVLAYARALGSTRAGVLETTFAEETGDRPVRGAVGAVRRHRGPREDGVRDARRGRLPARARLFRDDARAEADRRPALSGRP
jgi:ketol-acid reductoisomerase